MDINAQAPDFGPMQPVYPPLIQLVRVTSGTTAGPAGSPTLYVSFTEQLRTDNLQPRDREPCLVVDVGGAGLAAGYYIARLAGSYSSLPVYEAVCCASGSGSTTFNNTTVTFNNTVVTITNGSVFNFGTSVSVSTRPGGTFSKPTQLVTGRPTWTPSGSTYPLLWGAYDHIEWEWDGWIRSATGSSSSTPGGSGWVAFMSVGRSPVADTDFSCITSDRVIAYTNITAARVVTLPPANSLPPGFILNIIDESGLSSSTNTISVRRQGTDQINRASSDVVVVSSAYGGGLVETNGVSQWFVRQAAGVTTYSASQTSYSITGSYANVTGLSITVPAGTYQIVVDGGYQWNPSAGSQNIDVRLFDGTVAIGNTDPTRIDQIDSATLGGTKEGTFSVRSTYTTTGTVTITLQAKVSAGGLTPAIINSSMFILKTG